MKKTCHVCRHEDEHPEWHTGEKMLGLGDRFVYFRCRQCGCLQLLNPPLDWDRYYPPDYYSLTQPLPSQRGMKSWLAGWRDRGVLTGNRGPGGWLARWFPNPRPDVQSLGRLPLRPDMSILEVGCGRGQLSAILYRAGFRHLAGVDPYLPEDVEVLPNLWVRRLALEEVSESYDLLMMHHVFEHLPQPRASLSACAKRLKASGKILLRLPTVESVAWERYRENWVQWDAPRHHFLHTRASLEILARHNWLGFPGHLLNVAQARSQGGFRAASQYCADWEMWFRLAWHYGAARTSVPVAFIRESMDDRRATSQVIRSGRNQALTNVQRKRNYALLQPNTPGHGFDRRQVQRQFPLAVKYLLDYGAALSPRLLAYHTGLLLTSASPNGWHALYKCLVGCLGWRFAKMTSAVWRRFF